MIFKNIKEYVSCHKKVLKKAVAEFGDNPPRLAIVQVGDVEASNRYVRNKIKDCEEIGIVAHRYNYNETITENELAKEVEDLQEWYDGLIVQLPLPKHIRSEMIVDVIKNEKDVDGFKTTSLFNPATPKGIMDYLRYCDFDVCGKDVVIIGRSEIVGKPLAKLMTDADATVTLCHSKSNLDRHLRNCDLIVCAVGKANFLDCGKIDAPVIDVGINFVDGKLVGDCFNAEGKDVTPVPGGVGLLTRLALLDNVVKARKEN